MLLNDGTPWSINVMDKNWRNFGFFILFEAHYVGIAKLLYYRVLAKMCIKFSSMSFDLNK